MDYSFHQRGQKRVRIVLDKRMTLSAHDAVGDIYPGMDVFGLTKGQFSLINLIDVVLQQTGAANVAISTWTAADADTRQAHIWLQSGLIRDLRFLMDLSFQSRQPALCEALINRFGIESIRISQIHAKFVLIRNETWNIVIRTSMNLNQNPRFEDFELSDDEGLATFLDDFLDELFLEIPPEENFTVTPSAHKRRFKAHGALQDSNNIATLLKKSRL